MANGEKTDAGGWDRERLAALLEAAKEAISRSRFVFGAINIVTIVAFSAEFNSAVPWLRHTVIRANSEGLTDRAKSLTELMDKDLTVVSAPLLGIKFSSMDLSVIGAISMAILATWMFYATRSENDVVSRIVKEAKTALGRRDFALAEYLYHGVAHFFMFMTTTHHDTPGGERPRVAARLAVTILLYAPFWVLVFIAVTDGVGLSISFKSGLYKSASLWSKLSDWEATEAVLRVSFCLVLSVFCFWRARDCARFETDTMRQLDDIKKQIEAPRSHSAATGAVHGEAGYNG